MTVPRPTYQEILDRDREEVPSVLRLENPEQTGPLEVSSFVYTSRDQHELEKKQIWQKSWQWVCREDHLSEPGATYLYDIADRSYILVRTQGGGIRCYVNSCLHRGRKLCDDNEWRSSLRCPFHGFTWNLDGGLEFVPSKWDFGHMTEKSDCSLPQVRVECWDGFVFIKPDPEGPSLLEFLGEVVDHFSRWSMRARRVEVHVEKVIDANWKVAQEAFCEAFHAGATHPQTVTRLGDVNSQVDVWENFSRVITPSLVPSPTISRPVTDEEMLRAMLDVRDDQDTPIAMKDGVAARQTAAELARNRWRKTVGNVVDGLSSAELVDSIDYTIFPNFHPWGGFNRIVYRFRPFRDRHDKSIMEVLLLTPVADGDDKTPASVVSLREGDSWTLAEGLGMLGKIFDQDEYNMHQVQAGLVASSRGYVTFGAYQEGKIRWFYKKLEECGAMLSEER